MSQQNIKSILAQIKLPESMLPHQVEALNSAREFIILETFARDIEIARVVSPAHERLSPLARAFLSRAHAEVKWALSGEVYPYGDDFDCIRAS